MKAQKSGFKIINIWNCHHLVKILDLKLQGKSHTRSAIPRSPTMKGIPAYSLVVKVARGVFQKVCWNNLRKKKSLLHPHLSRLFGTARMPRRFPRGWLLRRGPRAAATTTMAASAVQDPRRRFLCLAAQKMPRRMVPIIIWEYDDWFLGIGKIWRFPTCLGHLGP